MTHCLKCGQSARAVICWDCARARRAPGSAFEAGDVDRDQADLDENLAILRGYPGRPSPLEQRQLEAAERAVRPPRYRLDPATGRMVLRDEVRPV